MDECISSHLKEQLAWAVDKWLWVISTIMLFKKAVIVATKELKGTNEQRHFKLKTILYALLCGP